MDVETLNGPETARQYGEARLRLALVAARAGAWEWDFQAAKATFSAELYDLLGLDPSLPPPDPLTYNQTLVHRADRERALAVLQTTIERRRPSYNLEFRFVRPDGMVLWLNSVGRVEYAPDGQPVRAYGIIQDVTDRAQAEEAMRQSEQRYRQLVSSLPIALCTCDSAGMVTFCNDRAAALLGLRPQTGQQIDLFSADFRLFRRDGTLLTRSQLPMAVAVRLGRSFSNEQLIVERPDGSRVVVLMNVDPIRDAQGRVIGAVNAFAEVTDRVRAEEALRESEAELDTIIENVTEGVIVVDMDGELIRWNRAAVEIHGFRSPDECRRQPYEFPELFELSTLDGSVVPVEQWPLVRLLRGEPVRDLEFRVRQLQTGRKQVLSYDGVVICDADDRPKMAVLTIRDITERVRRG